MSERQPAAGTLSSAGDRRRALRRRRRLLGIGGGVLVLSLVGGAVALGLNRVGTVERYRTAVAATATVEQTIEAVGTVSSVDRVDAAFGVPGTVATVDVQVGDVVAVGQQLATLDTSALTDALEAALAILADAEEKLEDDLAAQTSTTTATETSTAPTPAAPSTGGAPAPTDPAVEAAVEAVRAAQQELLARYGTASAALEMSGVSLAASQEVCAAVLETQEPPVVERDGGPVEPAPGEPVDGETGADPTPTTEELVACQAAIEVVLTGQEAVEVAQSALLEASQSLDAAVTAAHTALRAAAASAATNPAATPTAATATAATVTSTPGSPTDSASDEVPSAEDILADQAAIDLASAEVAIAESDLARVTLTTPLAGVVGAVSLVAGDAVSAGSTSAVVSVLGETGHLVTTTLGLSVIDTLEVGQTADITVASTTEALTGTVASIGVLNASTTSADPTYTVVLAVDPTDAQLFEGASASVVVNVGASDGTITVPTSAVHVDGGATTVAVLRGDEVAEVAVVTGSMGTELTEIVSGLEVGDVVVLADLTEPMVTDETSGGSGLTGLGGESTSGTRGFPAGGVPPGLGVPSGG